MKPGPIKNILSDKELWLIFGFNIVLLYTYYTGETSASLVVAMYYIQSLFIGLQYFIRMLTLGGRRNPESGARPGFGLAFFFCVHYGIFHFVYAIFLISILNNLPGKVDFETLRWFALALLGNTVLSTISDIKRDKERNVMPIFIMFQPYLRIVPMHLLIMAGFSRAENIENAFMLFIILKIIADVILHIIVNKTYKDKRPEAVGVFF